MGTVDYIARGYPCDGLAFHPGRCSNIPSRLENKKNVPSRPMIQKPELNTGTDGSLGS